MKIMEKTSDTVMDMDVDSVGASDNSVNQVMPSTEPKEPLNLLEMPREMLEHILICLEDKDLLTVSYVCKMFTSIAETAFALKYSKRCYKISCWNESEKSFHDVMLTRYGEKIRDIHAFKIDKTFADLIERNCYNLRRADFGFALKLPMLKNLKEFRLYGVDEWNRDSFIQFIHDNDQLEKLAIGDVAIDFINVLDGRLNMLKNLRWRPTRGTHDLPPILLPSLETLELVCARSIDAVHILRAINCNSHIKKLAICYYDSHDDDVINEICAFKSICELQLPMCNIKEYQLKKLAVYLRHLTKLGIGMAGHGPELEKRIRRVLSFLRNLKELSIQLKHSDLKKILNHLKTSAGTYDFQGSFEQFDTEIVLIDEDGDAEVATSEDRIFIRSKRLLLLYWMKNLNEVSLRKVLNELSVSCSIEKFKFVNHCEEYTVDMATFMVPTLNTAEYFEIKTNGPVTVNANATRCYGFFPFLDTLKIHLEHYSPMQLLQCIDERVCKQIKKLCLHGTVAPEEQSSKEAKAILSKFVNCKSLDLSSSLL